MHTGHRQRMRNRIEANGINSLADHEVLEYLLYFVQPRVNVNDTAHRLISTFGNLNGVLNATREELARVEGIGEISAQFLSLLPELFQRYWSNRSKEITQMVSMSKIIEEFEGLFLGARVEKMAAIFLDGKHEIISSEILAVGSRFDVRIHPKELVSAVIRTNADFVILGHNHPNNKPKPSVADIELTMSLKKSLYVMGVVLLDHVIICPDGSYYNFSSDPNFK